jgi:uncharacterized membrane protein YdbT with pleckstrin-like domain
MRYIEKILQPGERLIYSGKFHWIVYWQGLALLILAFFLMVFERGTGSSAGQLLLQLLYSLVGLAGAGLLLVGWYKRATTEIDVTDKRVILKRGFISRETTEMNTDKIVSVDVTQSILGRILDYGTITINGPGDGDKNSEKLRNIASPLELRTRITAP